MFVSPNELYTHLYPESIDAISGENEGNLIDALSAAISEVRGYLHRFDLDKIFSTVGDQRDALLVMRIKDIGVWYYINIANPQVNYNDRLRRYDIAIAWLKGVQAGEIVPDFPKPEDPDGNIIDASQYAFGSNPKRDNHV